MKNVRILEINEENWYECCQLELTDDQEQYMESNAVSIAQTRFDENLKAYAIYLDGQVVGLLMFNTEKEELDGYWIYRIMLDKNYQNKGIGKVATELMITEMAQLPGAHKIVVGYHPENKGAHKLYESLGFVDQGDRFGKEMAVVKSI